MEKRKNKTLPINNFFYDDLKEKWHDSKDHPVALLRAENALRNPWIKQIIAEKFTQKCKILDIGCGAGFLTNDLARDGHQVFGIDLSEKSIEIAKVKDSTRSVNYQRESAYHLPFEKDFFDIVCAMDLLEHVEKPSLVIQEVSRVLKKDGIFFFHTFNRNFMSYLMIIKGVEWCFYNTPPNMHVYPLFLKPEELTQMCERHQMNVEMLLGVRPDFKTSAFWKMVFLRRVDPAFRFMFTSSLSTGYSGFARKL